MPDPRINLASTLHSKSDNMFDRLGDLKSLFVSGLIFRFYNCPGSLQIISLNQNQANVVMLSLAALKIPYIKLNTLFQPPSDGGCSLVSLSYIQKSISVHTIILLLSGLCDKWVYCTYRRDLLRIVQANCFRNEVMKFLPFESIFNAGLHYLFGLPLISSPGTGGGSEGGSWGFLTVRGYPPPPGGGHCPGGGGLRAPSCWGSGGSTPGIF